MNLIYDWTGTNYYINRDVTYDGDDTWDNFLMLHQQATRWDTGSTTVQK